jgi:hypothetical protein
MPTRRFSSDRGERQLKIDSRSCHRGDGAEVDFELYASRAKHFNLGDTLA